MKLRERLKGIWIVPVAVLIDQAVKGAGPRFFGETLDPAGLFRTHPVRNTGMAFSMFSENPAALNLLTLLLLAALTAWLLLRPRELNAAARAALWLVVGGGLGNLVDRLRLGYVVDFIEPTFIRFPTFNLADCFVVGGALSCIAALLIEELRRRKKT